VLTTFLETYMKLLRDNKAVKGLQKLINRCFGTELGELHIVCKIRKHKTRTGREMRLTAQIRERNGSSYSRFGIRCKCSTETDIGVNGETCATMVSNSAKNGKSTENNTHGVVVGSNRGY